MEKSFPTFSIILPSYNSALTIRASIDSILEQSFSSFELIIIDDSSTDNTLEILNQYKKKAKVKIIRLTDNAGAAHCMNLGIRNATGEIIGIFDSDATAPKDWLNKVYTNFSKKIDVVGGRYKYTYDEKSYFGKSFYAIEENSFPQIALLYSKSNLYEEPTIAGGNFFFKNNIIQKVGIFETSIRAGYDRDFLCRVLDENLTIFYNPDVYVYHPLYNYKNILDVLKRSYVFGCWRNILIRRNKLLRKNYYYLLLIPTVLILIHYIVPPILIGLLVLALVCLIIIRMLHGEQTILIPGILLIEFLKKITGLFVFVLQIQPKISSDWKNRN